MSWNPAGDKLRVVGAEISAGGAQLEALEAAKSTFLRIHFNGTHKSACCVTLGYQPIASLACIMLDILDSDLLLVWSLHMSCVSSHYLFLSSFSDDRYQQDKAGEGRPCFATTVAVHYSDLQLPQPKSLPKTLYTIYSAGAAG